jgi:hypothetical protein
MTLITGIFVAVAIFAAGLDVRAGLERIAREIYEHSMRARRKP